jgi:5-methylcytosine-specific restriction endonuclease McrA
MTSLSLTRTKIYRIVARQLHGVVPCWICGQPVAREDATLEHIKPRSEGGCSHIENLAISHGACNHRRHAKGGGGAAGDVAQQGPVAPEPAAGS